MVAKAKSTASPRAYRGHTPNSVGVCVSPSEGAGAGVRSRVRTHEDADSARALLASLPVHELKQQLDKLALELQTRQAPNADDRDLITFSDCVCEQIKDVLAGNISGNTGALTIRQLFKVGDTWAPIATFLQKSGFNRLTPAEKVSVYRFLAELVVRHAYTVSRRSRAPLSPKLVVSCSGNLAGLFEREFPGYLRAGVLGVVVRRLCHAESI